MHSILVISPRFSSFLKCYFRLSPAVAFKSKPTATCAASICFALASSTAEYPPLCYVMLGLLLMKLQVIEGTVAAASPSCLW